MAERKRKASRKAASSGEKTRPASQRAGPGTKKRGTSAPGSKPARKERDAPKKGRLPVKEPASRQRQAAAERTAPERNGHEPLVRGAPLPAEGAGADRSGKYVYCIIQSTKPMSFGSIGIGAEPKDVYTIGYQDIAAVVSDTPLEVYDPTRENVLSHESVNERVMHEYTVIPMSFGTVFKTADDIVELLRSAYSAFHDVLQKMENKLEIGLKVLWDPDEVIQMVEKEDEGLRRLREEILKQRGSTYFARMQYGRLVDSLLQERSTYYVHEIFEELRSVSVASRANKIIGERMIMNAAFLVSRDKEPEFDTAVKAIGSRYPHLTFKYTGPWPPYNFVNIRLKLERAEDAG